MLLGSFPESLIDEDLHIHATVQGASLCVGVLGGGVSGTVARGGNDSPHGNISFLEKIARDSSRAFFAELLIELLCPGA